MRSSLKLLALGAALAFGAAYSTAALAADKEQVIKDRQAFMKDQGRQWLVIRNYTQGKADQAAAEAAVESLTKSVAKVPDYFPPDTGGPAPDGKWGTKPEIWSEHDKFLEADKKVADQVAALGVAVKSGDKDKVAAAFKDLNMAAARATKPSAQSCSNRSRCRRACSSRRRRGCRRARLGRARRLSRQCGRLRRLPYRPRAWRAALCRRAGDRDRRSAPSTARTLRPIARPVSAAGARPNSRAPCATACAPTTPTSSRCSRIRALPRSPTRMRRAIWAYLVLAAGGAATQPGA